MFSTFFFFYKKPRSKNSNHSTEKYTVYKNLVEYFLRRWQVQETNFKTSQYLKREGLHSPDTALLWFADCFRISII